MSNRTSGFPSLKLLLGRCRNLLTFWIHGALGMLLRMNGHIFGARLNILLNKLISSFVGLLQLPHLQMDVEIICAAQAEIFSFGCFWGTGLTLKTCSEGKISTYLSTIVCRVYNRRRKLCCTCFLTAHLLRHYGFILAYSGISANLPWILFSLQGLTLVQVFSVRLSLLQLGAFGVIEICNTLYYIHHY